MTGAIGPQLAGLEYVLPELILVGSASLLLLLDLVVSRKRWVALGALAGCVAATYVVVTLFQLAEPVTLFNGMYRVDGFGNFFKLLSLKLFDDGLDKFTRLDNRNQGLIFRNVDQHIFKLEIAYENCIANLELCNVNGNMIWNIFWQTADR